MLSTVAEVSDRNRWPTVAAAAQPCVAGYADSRLRRPIARAHPCACMAAQLCLTDVSEQAWARTDVGLELSASSSTTTRGAGLVSRARAAESVI
jgi:hypothetical protein